MGLSLKNIAKKVVGFGEDLVKPLAQFPLDVGSLAYNKAVAPVAHLPQQNLQQNPVLGGVSRFSGANGSVRQAIGSGVQTALTIGTGGIDGLAARGAERFAVNPLIARAAANAAVGAGFGAANGFGAGDNLKQTLEQAGVGAALGGAGTLAIPAARGAVRFVADRSIPLDESGHVSPLGRESPKPSQILPKHLAGAKPSYSFGNKQFSLSFPDDVSKSLYIIAGNKPSARESEYLSFLRPHFPGKSDSEIKQVGQVIKANIKEQARVAPAGGLTVGGVDRPQVSPASSSNVALPQTPLGVGHVSVKDNATAKLPVVKTKSSKIMPDEVTDAINRLHAHYGMKLAYGDGDVVAKADAYRQYGQRLSSKLWSAMNKHLSDKEQNAIYDDLQGVVNKDLTPKARAVSDALKPLYNTAADVRTSVDSNFNKVLHYAPRIARNTLGNAVRGKGVKGAIKSIADLGDLRSVFSQSRKIGKFVDKDGNALYGRTTDLGLTNKSDGTIVDKTGKRYQQVATNTRELQQQLGIDYLTKAGHVSGIYHADTTALKARADAVRELTTNPNKHGLYTESQVQSGIAPDGVREVKSMRIKDANGSPLYATDKVAKGIEKSQTFGVPETSKLPGKAYDAVSNFATQSIVLNPWFHGMNQLYQAGIAAGNLPGIGTGWARLANGINSVGEKDIADFFAAGGHSPDYGSSVEGWLSDLTKGGSKANAKAMASIELRLRAGLFKASVEAGMKPGEAIKNIDLFMGDSKQLSKTARRITIFGHYFKTMTKTLGTQLAHPNKQQGSIINAAGLAAITAGVSYGYQQLTGNKNAYVRLPGELGLGKEIIGSAEDLAKGNLRDATDIATNRLNPVAKEGVQQYFNTDLFTGKPVDESGNVQVAGHTVIPGGRPGHAVQGLIAPTQQLERGAGGKRNITELATNQLGLNTPHATGNLAAPKVGLLNAKGSKAAPGNDPTGYQQQQTYFDTTNQAKQGLSDTDTKEYEKLTGATKKYNDSQMQAHYAEMAANPSIVARIVKQRQDYAKQTGTPVDPLYSSAITPAQRQAYFHLQSLPYKGDDYNQQKDANSTWLANLQTARTKFFNDNPIPAGQVSKSERVQPPVFDPQTEADLTTASGLSGSDKAKFINSHPNLTTAYDSLAKYTNDKRVAEGNAALKLYPNADPDTQTALNTYQAISTSKGRSAWIKANPSAYAKVQDYLTNVSQYELANSAGSDRYQGATPSQEELKSAYGLGQYDITKGTNPSGQTVYSINPAQAYQQNSGSYGSSSSFDTAGYETAKLERNQAEAQARGKRTSFSKSSRVSVKTGARGKKVAMRNGHPVLNKKVALKKSRV